MAMNYAAAPRRRAPQPSAAGAASSCCPSAQSCVAVCQKVSAKPGSMLEAAAAAPVPAAQLLLGVPDAVAINIASHLTTALDLLRLARAHRRFRAKTVGNAPLLWSIVEEAARQWYVACSTEEQARAPAVGNGGGEPRCWKALMHEVLAFRAPLVFGRSWWGGPALVSLSNTGAEATMGLSPGTVGVAGPSAQQVMRAGRHFAEFTLVSLSELTMCNLGVTRPGWWQRDEVIAVDHDPDAGPGQMVATAASLDDGSIFFHTHTGQMMLGSSEEPPSWWVGMAIPQQGDRIGMLLDLE